MLTSYSASPHRQLPTRRSLRAFKIECAKTTELHLHFLFF